MHNFKDLLVWEKAIVLVEHVYKVSKTLPALEQHNLTLQLNRAAVSIPSNIAEGASRDSDKEFCRFLDIALGSGYELETQLILTERIFGIDTTELRNEVQAIQ